MGLFKKDKRQPKVTCLECGTDLGEGTKKDVFSHLITCLHVELNSLDNIRDNAQAQNNENGRRILHIVDALQGSVTE